MSENKFIVTLKGYNVETATPEQCSVHSDYPIPKMEDRNYKTIKYTFASNPGAGTLNLVTITHGYNYIPMSIVFAEDTSGTGQFVVPVNWYIYRSNPGPIMTEQIIRYYMDSQNLKIDYIRNDFGGADPGALNMNGRIYTFKHYIFVENL